MKRYRRLLAFLCSMLLLISLAGTAFADDSGIKNVIKDGKSSTPAASSSQNGPSAKDIKATGDDKKIEMPNASSYYADYVVMYVNAEKEHSVYGHKQPGTKNNEKYMPTVYHGTKVIVLAEQGGFSCVLYHSDDNALHAAWVDTDFLAWDYPGRVITLGTQQNKTAVNMGDPEVSWSKGYMVGTKQKYTLLSTPIEDCVGFTLDYQVTARNGADTKQVTGLRTIYINDGDGWIEVGEFDLTKLEPVHVTITLQKSVTLKAVATVADCAKPDTFQFRQGLLDVYTA